MAEHDESHSDDGDGKDQGDGQSQDQKYKVVVDGVESEVSQDELIAGYQRQQDYTRKTQDVKAREGRIEELVETRAEALALEAMRRDKEEGRSDADDKGGDKGEAHTAELADLRKRVEHAEQASVDKDADRELDGILKVIGDKYKKADLDKVLINFYNDAKETDDVEQFFEEAAKASHEAAEKYDQDIIDAYVKRKTENPFSAGESGGQTTPSGKAPEPAKDFAEARERMEQRIEAARGQR